MKPADHRLLSAAEAARALGVSTRALRLYEQKGLVTPARTTAGWRAYGPEALTRLHQVLALRRMGLSLARIGELLRGRLSSLEAVLALQEQVLSGRVEEASRALELVRRARARMSAGEPLSVDDLTTLTRETAVSDSIDEKAMQEAFEPLIRKHYDRDSLDALSRRSFDQEAVTRAWNEVIADAEAAMAKGDPTTPEAIDVARRWQGLIDQFTGGDPDIARRNEAMWREAMAEPATASKLPYGPELMDFICKAREAAGRSEASR